MAVYGWHRVLMAACVAVTVAVGHRLGRTLLSLNECDSTAGQLVFPIRFVTKVAFPFLLRVVPSQPAAVYQPTLTSLNEIVKYPVHRRTPLMLGRIA